MTLKLSVIIPIYNEELYLEECLNSIFNQSLQEIEVICVDDGSTDRSLDILNSYKNREPRLKILHQQRQYAGSARNLGLTSACGEYIHFMDADDWLEPDIYEEWYNIAKDQNADVCIVWHKKHDMLTGKTEYRKQSISKNYVYVTNFTQNAQNLLNVGVIPWNKIYRRAFLVEKNLCFDHLLCANDRSFFYKMISSAERIAFLGRYGINYRYNIPGALTGETRLQHFDCHFKSFEIVWAHYHQADMNVRTMILHACIIDMFAFFSRAKDTQYEEFVLNQLRTYLYSLDLSEFTEFIKEYSWYIPYLLLIKSDATYLDIYTLLHNSEDQKKYIRMLEAENASLKKTQLKNKKYEQQLSSLKHSVSFKTGRLVTLLPRKLRGFMRQYKQYGIKYTLNYTKWYFEDKVANLLHRPRPRKLPPFGITREKRKEKIIVSLTSYPGRIHLVHKTIETLLNQTLKPDEIILWLADSQFPKKEQNLPKNLLNLQKCGLTIRWCEDIRSYKKLIPALKLYPNDVIVTVDDDAYYEKNWLQNLYASYETELTSFIHCHRITRFYHVDEKWHTISAGRFPYPQPTYLHKLVGLGGVLYPPHCLHQDVLDESKFMTLAPTNDDIWFWLMAVLNGTRITVVPNANPTPKLIEESQNSDSLSLINDHGENLFWKDFNAVVNAYPEIIDILNKEYSLMHTIETLTSGIENKDEEYYKNLSPDLRPYELMIWYRKRKGFYLDLKKPKTLNDKIQWMKLYDSTDIKTLLSDKYEVRKWVKERIGAKYLIPLLGVWDDANDIDFDLLPHRFVIKANHGSGYNIIVNSKNELDIEATRSKLNSWLTCNYACKGGMELHYWNIKPKIIAEAFIDNIDTLCDYKFLCFNGNIHTIWVDSQRHTDHRRDFFDLEWNHLPIKQMHPNMDTPPQRPENLDEMIQIVNVLCQGFAFVRVDLYDANGKIYFGEMTFTSGNGGETIIPKSYAFLWGDLITLPEPTAFIPTR